MVRVLDPSAALGIVSTVTAPAGSAPEGLTAAGGRIYVWLTDPGGVASSPSAR